MPDRCAIDIECVERCITLLKEMTAQILPDDGSKGSRLVDALHLTLTRGFLIAYAMQRAAGLDHEAALRMLNNEPAEM
jgi:hypothetical protein